VTKITYLEEAIDAIVLLATKYPSCSRRVQVALDSLEANPGSAFSKQHLFLDNHDKKFWGIDVYCGNDRWSIFWMYTDNQDITVTRIGLAPRNIR
jgi:hypothetical protein